MLNIDFLITSMIVVLLPGTGVIYTVSTGLFLGRRASIFAAIGCTLGIVPHLLASILGLATILHMSAMAFQVMKFVGVAYLLYLAWTMWKETGVINLEDDADSDAQYSAWAVTIKGVLINILNPKLSLFFLAFLPQFAPAQGVSPLLHMLLLSGLFMFMTLVVFIIYGFFANKVRSYIVDSPGVLKLSQRAFALVFAALGAKLAMAER